MRLHLRATLVIGGLLFVLALILMKVFASDTKTAGYYTDQILQAKQQIIQLNSEIAENKKEMCKLPNADANWTCEGLRQESGITPTSGTATKSLPNQPIE